MSIFLSFASIHPVVAGETSVTSAIETTRLQAAENCATVETRVVIVELVKLMLMCVPHLSNPEDPQFIQFSSTSTKGSIFSYSSITLGLGKDKHYNKEKESADVTLRVDDNETYTTFGISIDRSGLLYIVITPNNKDFISLIDQIANGRNMYIKAHNNSITIPLIGITKAIDAFKQRLTLMPPLFDA